MLLIELPLRIHDPPAPDRRLSELLLDQRLNQRPLHRLPKRSKVDHPLRMRPLSLLKEDLLPRRHSPLIETREDLARREDEVGRAGALRRPRRVVLVLREGVGEVGLFGGWEAVEEGVDFVERDGA